MSEQYWSVVDSPIGQLFIRANDEALVRLEFMDDDYPLPDDPSQMNDVLRLTEAQLREYFEANRQVFELPLAIRGTEFQKEVWRVMSEIPYGRTKTYRQLAVQIQKPAAMRAVGAACGRNPLPIVIPCHRVVGSTGNLTGFGGGIWRKEWLLSHELRHAG